MHFFFFTQKTYLLFKKMHHVEMFTNCCRSLCFFCFVHLWKMIPVKIFFVTFWINFFWKHLIPNSNSNSNSLVTHKRKKNVLLNHVRVLSFIFNVTFFKSGCFWCSNVNLFTFSLRHIQAEKEMKKEITYLVAVKAVGQ